MMWRILLAARRLVVLCKVDSNPAAKDFVAIANVRCFFSTPLRIKCHESETPELLRVVMVDKLHVRDITVTSKKVCYIRVLGVTCQPAHIDRAKVALLSSPPSWRRAPTAMVLISR